MIGSPGKPGSRRMSERRIDTATADIIEVGLMFMKIFGRNKGRNYFVKTSIQPSTYDRVIVGLHRGTGPRINDDPTQTFIE